MMPVNWNRVATLPHVGTLHRCTLPDERRLSAYNPAPDCTSMESTSSAAIPNRRQVRCLVRQANSEVRMRLRHLCWMYAAMEQIHYQ